jgi:hypothetical protein
LDKKEEKELRRLTKEAFGGKRDYLFPSIIIYGILFFCIAYYCVYCLKSITTGYELIIFILIYNFIGILTLLLIFWERM